MLKTTKPLVLALLLAFATGCAKENAPAPSPAAAPQVANNQAPIDPNDDGGGGGPVDCVDEAMPEDVQFRVQAYVAKEARLRRWTLVRTPDAPDGITYGRGCNGLYVFSVDYTVPGRATYASGVYNNGSISLN